MHAALSSQLLALSCNVHCLWLSDLAHLLLKIFNELGNHFEVYEQPQMDTAVALPFLMHKAAPAPHVRLQASCNLAVLRVVARRLAMLNGRCLPSGL
jgi:hypothetical protein